MQQSMHLDNASIKQTIETLQILISKVGITGKDALRTVLAAEEILLTWQAKFGTEVAFDLRIYKRFFKSRLVLSIAGELCNPLPQPNEDELLLDAFNTNILFKLTPNVQFCYENGVNRITIPLVAQRKGKSTHILLWHIAAAICLATALRFAPQSLSTLIIKDIVTPLTTAFSGFLTATMTFMIFFSIAASIVNLGSIQNFYSLAGRIIKKFLTNTALCATVTTIILYLILPLHTADTAQNQAPLRDIRDMILHFVPMNFVSPFIEKNIPQVILISTLISIIILSNVEKLALLKKIILDANTLFVQFLNGVTHFIPIFVACCILQSITMDFTNLLDIALLVITINAVIVTTYGLTLFSKAAVQSGRPVWHTLKQGFPVYLVAFLTMSSSVTFPAQKTFCQNVLKLPPALYNFALPAGLIFNSGSGVTHQIIIIMTCMCLAGVSVSWSGLLLLTMQAVVMALAAPPVPGGILLILAIMFNQYGIPAEFLGLAALLMLTFDGIGTVANAMSIQGVLMDVERELKK